jgi:hypothetical protein
MLARLALRRPPHPALNVRDDREAPLFSSAGREQVTSISEKTKAEYLSRREWTGGIGLKGLAKCVFTRTRFSPA